MAVHYTGGGGLFSSLVNALGMASMFVPGLQGAAPYLMGANALAKGDVPGAIGSVAAPMIGKQLGGIFGKAAGDAGAAAATPAMAAGSALDDSLMNAHRQNFQPPDNNDYVNMRLDSMREAAQKPVNDALDVAALTPNNQGLNQALDTAAYTPQNESLFQALTRHSPSQSQMNPQTAFQRMWRR
jgi:hypothetical protein